MPIDIYARVPRVGAREVDSYPSPAIQEERCRSMVAAAGAAVGDVFVDEDVSRRRMSRGVGELEAVGALLMVTSEALDTSNPVGRFELTVFAALTELESGRIRDWEATHGSMISRGIQGGPHVPVGQRRGENKAASVARGTQSPWRLGSPRLAGSRKTDSAT